VDSVVLVVFEDGSRSLTVVQEQKAIIPVMMTPIIIIDFIAM
jgi:hypothetical protein